MKAAAVRNRSTMAGKTAMRSAVLGAGRKRYSNHHQRNRSQQLHAVILRLFQENGQRFRLPARIQHEAYEGLPKTAVPPAF
jgi:hypothetical protein